MRRSSPSRRSPPDNPPSRIAGAAVVVAATVIVLGVNSMSGGRSPGGSSELLEPSGTTAAADPTARPAPGHELYGFVPYWEMDGTIAKHLATTDLTTIALFSVTHTGKGAIAETQTGYRRIAGPLGRQIIAEAHDRNRRVDLTYTSFGRDKNAALFASTAVQDRVIGQLVQLRRDLDVDGVAVDVEQIDDTDIPAYGAFVGRLREALRADDRRATVTVTTTAGPQGAALALAATLAGADRIFVMGYDYRTGGSEPGASAPIARRDGDERSLPWSLDLYEAAGVPVQKTLLGLPLYGVAWPAASSDLGAAATGRGAVWVPRQNLATLRDRTLTSVVDPIEEVAFLAVRDGRVWQAIYFDTPDTLEPKLTLADDRGLAGAGLWAVGYERGLPGYSGLFEDFREGRLTPGS